MLYTPFTWANDTIRWHLHLEERYGINQLIKEQARDVYQLRQVDDSRSYGNNLKFYFKNNIFTSYYSAPCGNDCFYSSKGRFKWLDKERLQLTLTYARLSGECSKPLYSKNLETDLGIFRLIPNDKGAYDLVREKDTITK